jgi:hypothetical protein
MIGWTIFFVVWAVCGVLAYGAALAQFQKRFPISAREEYRMDVVMSLIFGVLGIVGLFFIILDWRYVRDYGFMYRRPKEKEKVDYSFPEGEPDWEI